MSENQDLNAVTDEISVVEIAFRYLREWKYFAVSIVVCMFAAYVYIIRTVPLYSAYSRVIVSDETRGQMEQDMITTFNDIGLVAGKNNLDNEVEILRSEMLMRKVADSLRLGIGYYVDAGFKMNEVYTNSPIFASVVDLQETGLFLIDSLSEDNFRMTALNFDFDFSAEGQYGQETVTPAGLITVVKNPYGTALFPITIELKHPDALPTVGVNTMSKTSSVVEISVISPNPQKGCDIVNTLIEVYNLNAIEEKNRVAKNTINFIDERLEVVKGELSGVEKEVEHFQRTEGVFDTKAQGQHLLSASEKYITDINSAQMLLLILQKTKEFVSNPANAKNVIPTNSGLTDVTVLNLITSYNKEVYEKEKMTANMTDVNPIVQEYNRRISSIKENLLRGIDISIQTAELTISELRRLEGLNRALASELPSKERESRVLVRQQSIKETVDKYLMQKREETGLSLALATPKAKVIDRAKAVGPVKPRKNIIYLAALIIALVIPVVIIYVIDLLDTTVHSREEVARILTAPFIGEIPAVKNKEPLPALQARSFFAEKLRIIGSKLPFIISKLDNETKVITITSSSPGEGKSFFARNFALTLASGGKKVLLIDLDLRKSVMKNLLDLKKQKGTTLFLADPSVTVNDIINRETYSKNLDIIPVKVYPPNPSELLSSNRLAQLFDEVKQLDYDYIIVDSAPFMLVNDTFIINRFSDATIFVIRDNYTNKKMIGEIQDLYAKHEVNNMSWIMNCVDLSRKIGYGNYKYGYGRYYVK